MTARTLAYKTKPPKGRDVAQLQMLLGMEHLTGEYDHATGIAVYRRKLLLGYGDKANHTADPTFIDHVRVAGTIAPPGSSSRVPVAMHATNVSWDQIYATATAQLKKAKVSEHEMKVRLAVLQAWQLLMARPAQSHYPPHDARRNTVYGISTTAQLLGFLNQRGGLYCDCSQTVDICSHVGGAKNPNTGNFVWRSDGYTGTEINGCRTITKAQALPADLHVYGPGTGHHVAQALTVGADPLMGSHGHDPIGLVLDSVEVAWQPRGGVWLRLPI